MSDSDLGDDIVQNELSRHIPQPPALRTDFKPWHRVRKQFIRERQWNPAIRFLTQRHLRRNLQYAETEWSEENISAETEVNGITTPENIRIERPLRCFMLPGDDLLDIRSLWRQLQNEGCYLKFLGFNKSIQDQTRRLRVDVAESAVTQLAKMCKDSQITADTFQDIARTDTQAFRLFRQYGPYDVINLDLCDSLVPRGIPEETDGNYTALNQIVRYQLENQKSPWLLFATTQVDRATASQPEINKLAKPTRENCAHAQFAHQLKNIIPEASFQSLEHTLDLAHLNASQLVQAFGIILGKWLISLLANASPRCSVKLLTSYRYVIETSLGIEMLSLGFVIAPHYTPPVDDTGMSSLNPTVREFPTELEIALDLVSIAAGIRNVDDILAGNDEIRQHMTNSKADLLAAAGYDRDEFLRWVASGERSAVT